MSLFLAYTSMVFAGSLTGWLCGVAVKLRKLGWVLGSIVSTVYGLCVGLAIFAGDAVSAWLLGLSFVVGCGWTVYRTVSQMAPAPRPAPAYAYRTAGLRRTATAQTSRA